MVLMPSLPGFCIGWLSLSQQVVLWGLGLVVLAVLTRRGWLKLFGPVLFYDLVRTARRSRYILIRSLYALLLTVLLLWVYLLWALEHHQRSGVPGAVPRDEM